MLEKYALPKNYNSTACLFLRKEVYRRIIKSPSAIVISQEMLEEIASNIINEGDVMVLVSRQTLTRALRYRDRATTRGLLFEEIQESCVFEIVHACGTSLKTPADAARIDHLHSLFGRHKRSR